MTTLVGIKTEKRKKAVVLGSDVNRTHTTWRPQGDVAYRQQRRTEGQKIYVDNKGEVALCMSGVFDQLYTDFLSSVLEGDIDIKEVIERGYFSQLDEMNRKRWEGRVANDEIQNGLLIATKFNREPKLHTCFPLGRVEERAYTSIGSGSGYALDHISEQGLLIPRRIGLNEGIDLTVAALDRASQDLYTGGLDLVVVTEKGIYDYGSQIRKSVDEARSRELNRIKRGLK